MGEDEAARESITCTKLARTYFHVEDNPHPEVIAVRLHSLSADILICVQNNASGYNNCRNVHVLGEAITMKSKGINGEMSIAS